MECQSTGNYSGFQVGGGKATYVLVVCSLLWMINFVDRQILSVVLEPMKLDLGLTDAQAGWISTSLFLGMAIFAIPVSYCADRWSRKKLIGIMAIAWSIATILTGLGKSFLGILLPRLATGTGQAGFSSAGMALISTSYPEEARAKKMGFFNLFQVVGIMAGSIFGGYLSVNFGGWKTPFIVFAVPGIILGFLAFWMQDYQTIELLDDSNRSHGLFDNLKTLLKIPTLSWFYAGYTMFTAMGVAVLTWLPALVIRKFGVDEDIAGLFMACIAVFSLIGVVLSGILADRWQKKNPAGRMRFAAVMTLMSTIGIFLTLICSFLIHEGSYSEPSIWLVIGMFSIPIFAITVAAVNPPVMAVSQSVVTQDLKGLAWGLGTTLVMIMGGAWSPTATGYLSDWFGGGTRGLTLALVTISFLGLGGFLCFWRSSLYYAEDVRKVKDKILFSI
ncbi:MAG: MFS transporter [Desulfobacteraceae bacterium]|nr:MFS transporter [Desulfobacteraceae bacterium]